VSGVLKSVRIE